GWGEGRLRSGRRLALGGGLVQGAPPSVDHSVSRFATRRTVRPPSSARPSASWEIGLRRWTDHPAEGARIGATERSAFPRLYCPSRVFALHAAEARNSRPRDALPTAGRRTPRDLRSLPEARAALECAAQLLRSHQAVLTGAEVTSVM